MNAHQQLAQQLQLSQQQVAAIAKLLADGGTVPFIARYRKEVTGSCDEVQIAAVRDGLEAHAQLNKRLTSIISSLQERSLLTEKLEQQLRNTNDLTSLEDIYMPFRIKRRSRASIARERGLESLAKELLQQSQQAFDCTKYIDAQKDVPDEESALAGARDIIAEQMSEDSATRQELRQWFGHQAELRGQVIAKRKKDPEAARFSDWFDWSESLHNAPSHRILALLRGAEQKVLRVTASVDSQQAHGRLYHRWCHGTGPARKQVEAAADDAWKRLIEPSLINEALGQAKERADADAIEIFQNNMRELLLSAPLGQKTVLAIDPGLRTGCKIAILGKQGDLLAHDVLHLATSRCSQHDIAQLSSLVKQYAIDAIAIGNGTGSREAEAQVRSAGLGATVCIVDESGASIYSASEVAREEFPDHDITVRGAVSIGRRLQDPLAELVKVEPKAIGVGQYQHDVDQAALKRGLDDTVMACVNNVGVELNSASAQLLAYVSGLGPKLAQAIVEYRHDNGPFTSRTQIKKVPRLGGKAFEQCAGFLRIHNGKQALDASAVHPERYDVVKAMAKDLGSDVSNLLSDEVLRQRIDVSRYISDSIGEPTLQDIMT
ncbi:MAG: helix-hairpin-helix domain-containing protein, partial [Planctomycetes bacterium]|nr:helix-hairpin-helix domain-containing protein [Planctomycetota bacterium]